MPPSLDTTPLPRTALSTVTFLTCAAYTEVTGLPLVVEHSLGAHGKFCWADGPEAITAETREAVEAKVRSWLSESDPREIESTHMARAAIIECLGSGANGAVAAGAPAGENVCAGGPSATATASPVLGRFVGEETLTPPLGLTVDQAAEYREILKVWRSDLVPVIRFGRHWDLRLIPDPVTCKSACLPFEIVSFKEGFVVRVPESPSADLEPFRDCSKLYGAIEENEHFGSILGVNLLADVNRKVFDGSIRELCWVAEALHDKRLSRIADAIHGGKSRAVCISGPSSSGKTTSARKLCVHLQVCGRKPLLISADDYFLDHGDMDEGIDFEHVRALNAELLQERVRALLRGEKVPVRKFNFFTGKGADSETETLFLGEDGVVVIEGIHMLNPVLWEGLRESPAPEHKPVLIYVTAITQLNVTSSQPCSAADNRLLRRIVRDHRSRGYSAAQTLERWPSVRRGERQWIFPYSELADHVFNSALIYEFNMLAVLARSLLCEVTEANPHVLQEAQRLITTLSLLYPVPIEYCPGTSLLREFLGRSDFEDGRK